MNSNNDGPVCRPADPSTWLRLVLLALVIATLPACQVLDMRKQSVESRIKMHAGSPWVVGTPDDELFPEAAQIYERDFKDKEIYFTTKGMEVIDSKTKIDLQVVNKWLICSPDDDGLAGPCRTPQYEKVEDGGDAVLLKCANLASQTDQNFVGLTELAGKKYCVHVSVIEYRDPNETFPGSPTTIDRDKLAINILDPDDGEKGTGIIPIKPRPNFRAPSMN